MMNAVEIRNLSKNFREKQAVSGLDMTVPMGAIYGFIGENGSGKTTLMNMLSGIYAPDAGRIFVDGNEVTIDSPEKSKKLGKFLKDYITFHVVKLCQNTFVIFAIYYPTTLTVHIPTFHYQLLYL